MFSCPPSITKTKIWRIGIQIFGGSDVVNKLHVRKLLDKMKRFEVTKISSHFQAKTVQLFFCHLRKKLIHLGMQTSTLESRSSCRKFGLHLLLWACPFPGGRPHYQSADPYSLLPDSFHLSFFVISGDEKPLHLVRQFSYIDVMTKVRYFLTNES